MPKARTFRPVRPLDPFDSSAAIPFDPRTPTFIPAESVASEHVRELNSRKLRLFGAKVYNSATQSIASDAAFHALTFDVAAWNQGGFWVSGTPTRLRIPFSGVYAITGFMAYAGAALGIRQARILLNGATGLGRYKTATLGAGTGTEVSITTFQRLTAGDYIELEAQQDSGAGLNIQDGEDDNFFVIDFRGVI